MKKITFAAAALLNCSISFGADATPLLQKEQKETPKESFTNSAFESSRQTINDVKIKSDEDIKQIEALISAALQTDDKAIRQGLLQQAVIFLPGANNSTKLFQMGVNKWREKAESKEEKDEATAAERDVLAHLARLQTLELVLHKYLNEDDDEDPVHTADVQHNSIRK